jgi:integrase/recombinase XerD
MISKAAARAGITRPDPRQRISPHKLRHTFGSLLAERGADIVAIRDLMGHASVATTQVYLHAHSDRLRREVEKL